MSPFPKTYNRKKELEWKLLYSLVVAGKNAKFAENVMERFMCDCPKGFSPFDHVRAMYPPWTLMNRLRESRSGNYTKLAHAFSDIANRKLNLETCTPQELERTKGIGPKTSRFFILWTRPGAECAALDTHILKWLRYRGYSAPKSTPTGKEYARLEWIFLQEAQYRKLSPGDLDYKIWQYAQANPVDAKNGIWPKDLQ